MGFSLVSECHPAVPWFVFVVFVFFLNSGERSLLKSVERVLEVQGKLCQVVPRRSSRSSSVFVVDARDAVVLCCVCVCEHTSPDAVCVSGAKKKQIKVRRGRKVVQKARKIAKFPRKGPAFSLDSNRNNRFTLSRRSQENRVVSGFGHVT